MKKLGLIVVAACILSGCGGIMVSESYYDNYGYKPCLTDECVYGSYYTSGAYINPGYSSVYYGGNGLYYHDPY